MRFLIAGCGSIGRRHLRNLVSLGERDIVLLRSGLSCLPDDELAGFATVSSLEAGLACKPDAVIVSNPTALHLDVAIPAASAGCHLLLEKPVSHSMEGVAALRSVAARGGGQVLVGFQYRFHPSFLKAVALLRSGAIGRPLSARAHYGEYLPGWHPWEDYRRGYSARADLGGGVALTLCHPFDYLRWFFGEVESVRGFAGNISDLDLPVEDVVQANLRFSAGQVASVHLNYFQRPPSCHFEVLGSGGTLRWDQADETLKLYRAETGAWEDHPTPAGFERNDMFLAEMRHFREVVRGKADPACTMEDGERALRLALAARDLGRLREPASAAARHRPLPARPALIVLDFDGVMTDNRVWVDARGREQVAASRGDGLGLALLRRHTGVKILVLSTESNRVVAARCRKLELEVVQDQKDKAATLRRLLSRRRIDPAAVIYVGNDVNDLQCFRLVGCAVAPADAHPDALAEADLVLHHRGGHGAVRELCDRLLAAAAAAGPAAVQ